MKKAVWGAFLLMTTLAAAGLCEMDYTLSNPHIRYEKIEGARPVSYTHLTLPTTSRV